MELAKEAEDNGWDGFFLWDHLNEPPQPMVDTWIALAAMAAADAGRLTVLERTGGWATRDRRCRPPGRRRRIAA